MVFLRLSVLCLTCCDIIFLQQKEGHNMELELNEMEREFLRMVHDPELRQVLLVHLEKLGLLSAFLQAESGTS